MDYGSTGITKLEYGTLLTAALAYLLVKQKDAAGLLTYDTGVSTYINPTATRSGLMNLYKELTKIEPGGETAFPVIFQSLAERMKRRGLVIVISYLLDDPASVIESVKMLRFRKHEVIVFMVLDPSELSFDFKGESVFEDMETGRRIPVQPWH